MILQTPKYTNSLINESSPYLLQHAHNPVNWQPWGQEALEKAANENKLLIVSIGYAACHWCHVMEHESFEDEIVAGFMNQHFVCIKVDREERPDIDQVYMNAVHLITGSGGWPLNCIALPDGRPIYGGTYFPKSQWLDMLSQVLNFAIASPEKAEIQAKSLTEGIKNSEKIYRNSDKIESKMSDLDTVFDNWKVDIDYQNGGQKRAPKFPLPVGLQFLLHYHFLSQNDEALRAVTITLDKMAKGGIYDQIGGGFSRYSVDATWKVPHFEKMLYDNAQLVSLYCAAYQHSPNPLYQQIVTETLEFINRELAAPFGGFYASLDADSEGVEGKYYVWTYDELEDALGPNAKVIIDYYSAAKQGNWEHNYNILYITSDHASIAKKHSITELDLTHLVNNAKETLLNKRKNRIKPGLDDKIITSWNALMIKAYADAYRVFEVNEYLEIALKNANFILQNLHANDVGLYRNYKEGKASINGFLDDYAFTIQAFITIYQATFDEKWLHEANVLTEYTLLHFYDLESGMFFYTSDLDAQLIARKMELTDNVIPASNSEMAKNLYILAHYFSNEEYINKAKQMLDNVKMNVVANGTYYANWDVLMAWFASAPYEIAIVGNDCHSKRKEFDKHYLPNVFLSGGKMEGGLDVLKNRYIAEKTLIYVCQNKTCKYPVNDVSEALQQM